MGDPAPPTDEPARREKAAQLLFAVAAVVACVVIVVMNRRQWFFHDDFVFAFDRDLADPETLLRPHFGHNTVVPSILFQLVYSVVGLHSFWPYQLMVVASHVGVAAVLRSVMVRCRVDPFLATSAAVLFLFFGSGRENLTWAFQTTLNGSLIFGFAALLTADREDDDRRRDVSAALLLCAAVLCSNLGPFMACMVGVAVVLRRGLRRATVIVAPPLALFGLWRVTAPDGREAVETTDVAGAWAWGSELVTYGFESLSHVPVVALLVGVVVLAAVVGLVRTTVIEGRWSTEAVPVALVVGLVALAASLGYTRGGSAYPPFTPRYTYLVGAFTVPVAAWALGRLTEGRRSWTLGACGLLLLGLPANIARIGPSNAYDEKNLGDPDLIGALASVASAEDATPGYELYGFITNEDIIRAERHGKVPTGSGSPDVRGRALLMVALGAGSSPAAGCRAVDHAGPVTLERGDRLQVGGSQVELSLASDPEGPVLTSEVPNRRAGVGGFDVVIDRIELLVRPTSPGAEVQVCEVERP